MENNIQDMILSALRKERKLVTVFTINGYQMKGRVTANDRETIVLLDGSKQMIAYKSALSTIVPETPVEL